MTAATILTMAREKRWPAKRTIRALNNLDRISDFRRHQLTLALSAATLLFGASFSEWLLAPAMLVLQAGWIETLRFRRTGCKFMTRRSIWIGATPVDENSRHLLNGWQP